jgi:FkbM family methyltransferase
MIIDFDYIVKRIDFLIEESQKQQNATKQVSSSWNIKKIIPLWIRKKLIRPVRSKIKNMLVCKDIVYKEKKYFLHPIAIDFMKYFFLENRNLCFDTSVFFEENSDAEITDFIDNKIRNVVIGLSKKRITDKQLKDILEIRLFQKKIKQLNDQYVRVMLNDHEIYYLPKIGYYDSSVFVHHCGLVHLSEKLKSYIKGKVFLDIGAYIGDSGLIFLKYSPSRIYAYEPVKYNYELLQQTIEKNNAPLIIPVNKGIGDKKDFLSIHINKSESSINSQLQLPNSMNSIEQIEVTTIDEECKDMEVGLIKMDIEGFEYYAIKGGIETIQRDKPVLIISVYHTGKDFFEIPPMIRKACPSYKFKYLDLFPSNPIAEKMILAYV